MEEYELTLILKPDLGKKDQKKVLDKVKKIIEGKKGSKVESVDSWGKKPLAYEIRDEKKGVFYLLSLSTTSKVFPELEKEMKLEENIIRYLIVRA